MAKSANDDMMDGALDVIATATTLSVCSSQPTTLNEATTTYEPATATLTAGDGNGDYTISDGDVDGRKVTVTEQADLSVDSSGDATHIALSGGTRLIYVTTCTTQTVATGSTVTVPTWKITFSDPS